MFYLWLITEYLLLYRRDKFFLLIVIDLCSQWWIRIWHMQYEQDFNIFGTLGAVEWRIKCSLYECSRRIVYIDWKMAKKCILYEVRAHHIGRTWEKKTLL